MEFHLSDGIILKICFLFGELKYNDSSGVSHDLYDHCVVFQMPWYNELCIWYSYVNSYNYDKYIELCMRLEENTHVDIIALSGIVEFYIYTHTHNETGRQY